MKKIIFALLFVSCSFSASGSVLYSKFEKLNGWVGHTLSFNFSQARASKTSFHTVPDTIWIKNVKDKTKIQWGKHYRLSRESKWGNDIEGRLFHVEKVVPHSRYMSSSSLLDSVNVYMREVNNPSNVIIWVYSDDKSGLIVYDAADSARCSQWINKECYLRTSDKYSNDDYRAYSKVKCINYQISYVDYLIEHVTGTVIDDDGKEHSFSKGVISSTKYETIKNKTIDKFKDEGRYYFTLSKIEKPKNPAIRYGKFQEVKTDDDLSKYLYEDNIISILWHGTVENFVFMLKNKSDNSLKIIWDEASFINEDNESGRIAHKGVRKDRLNESQPPTVIPKGTELNDMVVPVDRVGDFLIPGIRKYNPDRKGKKVMILLPIEIKGVTNEYTFTFDLVWKYSYPEFRNSE